MALSAFDDRAQEPGADEPRRTLRVGLGPTSAHVALLGLLGAETRLETQLFTNSVAKLI